MDQNISQQLELYLRGDGSSTWSLYRGYYVFAEVGWGWGFLPSSVVLRPILGDAWPNWFYAQFQGCEGALESQGLYQMI